MAYHETAETSPSTGTFARVFAIQTRMPRPRKNDPTPLIRPILADFARALGAAVERNTLDRVRLFSNTPGTFTGTV